MCATLVSAYLPCTYEPFACSPEPSASPTASSQDPRFYEFVFESDEEPTVKTRTDSVNVCWSYPKIATFSYSPPSATPEPHRPPLRSRLYPGLVPPPGALCLTMWRLDMPSHYSPTCRGCVFPIGWNTSSATSLIVGLTAAAPNRPAPGAVPGGNALVTTAMH